MKGRPKRRWLKPTLLAVAAILVLFVAPAAYILYPTFKSYPTTDSAPAATQADKNLRDIEVLARLPEVDRSFTVETREAFEQSVADLKARAPQLDRAGFAIGAARAVALADNAHTAVAGLVAGHGFNALPMRVGWFQDGLFVVAAKAAQRDLLGARILRIDDRPPADLLPELKAFIGGPASMARELSPNLLQSPELLHAAGLAKAPDAVELQLVLPDGTEATRSLAAEPGAAELVTRSFWQRRHLSPAPLPGEGAAWTHVLDAGSPPFYLARPDANVWHDYLASGAVLYVQINRVRDQDGMSLSQYLADAVSEAEARKVRHAVVDLRFNSGGDYTQTADFTEQLPAAIPPDGKLFVLVGGTTFSAAIVTAARLKYFAGGRGILVGEPMGDRTQFWGEGGSQSMPHSKLSIRYASAYHDWENGCSLAQIRTCFFLNYIFGTPSGSLEPAVPLQQPFASYAAGKDMVLDEVLKRAKSD